MNRERIAELVAETREQTAATAPPFEALPAGERARLEREAQWWRVHAPAAKRQGASFTGRDLYTAAIAAPAAETARELARRARHR